MANRSYLYSVNRAADPATVAGVAEWNYDIPLAFKILASGAPALRPSIIWPDAGKIAIESEYSEGVHKLIGFLARIQHPKANGLLQKAKEFLESRETRGTSFILECGEIFDIRPGDLEKRAAQLLSEIQDIDRQVEQLILRVNPGLPPSSSAPTRLIGRLASVFLKRPRPEILIQSLGLSNWTNYLFYDPEL